MSAFEAMDRMYRHQRHIYDLSRRFYLIGRDATVDRLPLPQGGAVCEVGCGTARNLVRLAKRRPDAKLYGIDASAEMLRTAEGNLARAGLAGRVRLGRAMAEDIDPLVLFGRGAPFDAVLFSYALSMIPDWQGALAQALQLLRPGGTLAVVDFGDRAGLPRGCDALLTRWLSLFNVIPRPEILDHLQVLQAAGSGRLQTERIGGGYAFRLAFTKSSADRGVPAGVR